MIRVNGNDILHEKSAHNRFTENSNDIFFKTNDVRHHCRVRVPILKGRTSITTVAPVFFFVNTKTFYLSFCA